MKKSLCYERALTTFQEFVSDGKKPVLVHGIVTGEKGTSVEDVQYTHAWVEVDNQVYDNTYFEETGYNKPISKKDYYKQGQIDFTVKYKTVEEVGKLVLSTGHCGPWDKELCKKCKN